ncbi:MAG: SH3 domain-containing protein [Saprospiraceae bacterium]|nr:SH3 domain-containing protein [Saprospiraceae bacterium]
MKLFISFIILSLQVIFVSGQSYSNGDIVYVISETGLNLRAEKNVNSQVVKLISTGRKLRILESDSITNLTSINNIKGSWVKVMDYLDSSIGFVFDYYLSKYPPFKFIRNNNNECWVNDVLLDLANELGKLDSIEYSNYSEGEGWYKMKYYKLNNEVKYIEHGHWEHFENELQFSKLNTYQIIHYVNSIMIHCKENNANIEQNYFEKNKILSLYNYGDCCVQNIRIYSDGNNLIIRIQSDEGS